MDITKERFEHEMKKAKTFQGIEPDRADYWIGYQRGLRRAYHGENFGTEREHTLWLEAVNSDDPMRMARGEGYRDGLRGARANEARSPHTRGRGV